MKNLQKFMYVVIGLLIGLSFTFTSSAWADTGTKALEATFRNIKLVVDGVTVTPKDANGNVVEPFMVGGTTYLPVRAVGNALGKEVSWDGATSTVYIGGATQAQTQTQKAYLGFDLKSYQSEWVDISSTVKMGGNTFGNAIVFRPLGRMFPASVDFNLDGAYTTINGKIGHVDGSDDNSTVLNIFGDEKLIKSLDLSSNMFGEDISLNVTGVKQLKFKVATSGDGGPKYALVEMELIK